ncbi:MAG: hypothetical protein GXY52_10810 [Chloroflexi bacterium]|nr:hypothetical protein [Chloroflexota bacterium]
MLHHHPLEGMCTDGLAPVYQYTSQCSESSLGLYDYGARWYDPSTGRLIRADANVHEPGNPQGLVNL